MYDILRIENHVTVKPLVHEGSPFIVSHIHEKKFTKQGEYKGVYFLSEYFEMKEPGNSYYSLHTWKRDVEVYLYGGEYFAIVRDVIICHVPDINGHRDLFYEVYKRKQSVCCGKEMPDRSLFEFKLISY